MRPAHNPLIVGRSLRRVRIDVARTAARKAGRRAVRSDRAARPPGRADLLEAAAALFAELGYDAVTTRQILERAGVEAPSLYHHFGSKLGLYRAVLSGTSEPFVERFERLGRRLRSEGKASVHDTLTELVWAVFRGALSNPEWLRACFGFYRALDTTIAQDQQRKTKQLAMPVLAIGGAMSFGGHVGEAMSLVADDVQSAVIPDTGHFLAEESPDELLTVLAPFLAPYRAAHDARSHAATA